MGLKRTSLHLDSQDLKGLARLAREESKRTGSNISAASIVRRVVREYLQSKSSLSNKRKRT